MRLFKSRRSIENISSSPTCSIPSQSCVTSITNNQHITGKPKSSSSSSSASSTTSCSTVEVITTGATHSLQPLSSSSLPDLYDSQVKILSCSTKRIQDSTEAKDSKLEKDDISNVCSFSIKKKTDNTNFKLNELPTNMVTTSRNRHSLPGVNSNSFSLYDKKHSLPTSMMMTSSNITKECSSSGKVSTMNGNVSSCSTMLQQYSNNNSNNSTEMTIIGNKHNNNGKKIFRKYYIFFLKKFDFAKILKLTYLMTFR